MLVATTALAMRAMYADLVYTSQHMQVIANREGNPFGIAIRAFGGLRHWRRLDCRRPASTRSSA
jgi:hypothetical protein